MRKIILSLAVSLDGYIAKPNGDVEWLKKVPNPDNLDYGFSEFYKTIDTTIMGNNTYKEILGFNIPFPFQDKENFILSRVNNPDTAFVHFTSDIFNLVRHLKSKNGKNIWLIGGGQINTEFLNKGLIDELLIRIVPIVIGEGLPLFANKPSEVIFEQIKTETFSTGIVQLTYRPRKE
ncbi:dihydrofolate reductase family protein [Olivibacter ginsenosidimutans]|uniref:Dihydrofolate reductase family protein n=1 Tax=Olivibacter ginsenosidimutans TaxID=1176537 RepID=A0ABP9BNP9_9SPHI